MAAASSRAMYHFKVVLLGNSGVGKSCLVNRFVRGVFHEDVESTIGAAFLTQTVALETSTVKFEIWDTAGQERYRSLAPMYYRGAQAAVVVFSLVDADSFNGAKAWVSELRKHAGAEIIIALAGNKADLGSSARAVDRDTALEYARQAGCFYLETSAKTAAGVSDLFREVATRVPKTAAPPRRAEVIDAGSSGSSKCC